MLNYNTPAYKAYVSYIVMVSYLNRYNLWCDYVRNAFNFLALKSAKTDISFAQIYEQVVQTM
jgi:hypothetical protein